MYPPTYLMLLALVLGIAFFLVRELLPARSWQPSLFSYFFLGGGFMLVETKAITELGLLFGNTWQVIGITILSVLVMAYLANLFAAWLTRRVVGLAFVGLFAILLVGYGVAIHGTLPHRPCRSGFCWSEFWSGRSFFRGGFFHLAERQRKYLGGDGV